MSEEEIAFYRVAEDHFAALRGTPFLFSPKDFALLRTWWREGVPLAAVIAGIGEVFERRRERSADPVSSLSYCRHAVARHARRLAAARAGAETAAPSVDVAAALALLDKEVAAAAGAWAAVVGVAPVLHDLRCAIASLPADGDPAALEATLSDLEFTTLDALLAALPAGRVAALERAVEEEMKGLEVTDEVEERTRRALLIKAVRSLVGIPRLELRGDAA
jgi:hypothetical protein